MGKRNNMQSIWKDYNVELSADGVQYRIILGTDGPEIYRGVGVQRPTDDAPLIKINNICADYMAAHSLPAFGNGELFVPQLLSEVFSVQEWDEDTEEWVAPTGSLPVEFLFDWSYDRDWDGTFHRPISSRLDGRQVLLLSVATEDNSVAAKITFADGSFINRVITVRRTADFNADFNADFARSEDEPPYGVLCLNLAQYIKEPVKVEIPALGVVLEGPGRCQRYALAYVNAYGGWDNFLPAEYETMTDGYTRHTIKTDYDNHDSTGRGLKNYANEITRTIAFRTGSLTDAGAANMHYLLGSTCVYLRDMVEGRWYPVIVTDAQCIHKTFRNQGAKRVEYTFNVQIAQDYIRR